MNKLDKYIKNLLNPPKEYEAGQVWFCSQLGEDILITEASFTEYKVVRSVIFSKIDNISDGIDVVIEKEKYDFLFSNRVALRLTDGPIPINQLSLCIGKINLSDLKSILQSLTNYSTEEYTPPQYDFVKNYLIKLEDLRDEALSIYEKAIEEKSTTEQEIYKIVYTNKPGLIEVILDFLGFGKQHQLIKGSTQELNLNFVDESVEIFHDDEIYGFSLSIHRIQKEFYYLVLSGRNLNTVEKLSLEINNEKILLIEESTVEINKRYFRVEFEILKKINYDSSINITTSDDKTIQFKISGTKDSSSEG